MVEQEILSGSRSICEVVSVVIWCHDDVVVLLCGCRIDSLNCLSRQCPCHECRVRSTESEAVKQENSSSSKLRTYGLEGKLILWLAARSYRWVLYYSSLFRPNLRLNGQPRHGLSIRTPYVCHT